LKAKSIGIFSSLSQVLRDRDTRAHNAPSHYAISITSLSLLLCKVDFPRDFGGDHVQCKEETTGNPTALQTLFVVATVYTALTHQENAFKFFYAYHFSNHPCRRSPIAAQGPPSLQDRRRCVVVANRGERPTRAPLFKDPGKKDSKLLAFLLA
jgi:hypothetical protein